MFHFKSVLSLILLVLMAGVNVARGETKPFTIVIDRVGAEPLRIEIKTSTEITFSEGNAVITTANEAPQTIPLEDLANMSFDGDMSSVEETLMTFDSGITIKSSHGVVSITPGEGAFVYKAFSVEGRMAYAGESATEVALDFTTLPAGVYIIVANDKVLKFVNR